MDGRKKAFIRALAEFLVKGQVKKRMEVWVGKSSAKEWAALRDATPLNGYPTTDEAEKILTEWLS